MAEKEEPKVEEVKVEEVKAEEVVEPKPVVKPPEPEPAEKPAEKIDIAAGEATPAQIAEIKAGNFYTIKQAAQELGYGPAWIISLIRDGRIKAMKPTGGQWRIPASEMERLRTEGIPPLPRKKPVVKADEIVVEGKHEERVKATEKKDKEKKSKYGFPLNIIFGEEEE